MPVLVALWHAYRDSRFAARRWHRFKLLYGYYRTPFGKL